MEALGLTYYLKAAGSIPAMDSEPYGTNRCDPDLVKEKVHRFVTKECDTCGREFSYERYKNLSFRNCSSMCTMIWDKLSRLKNPLEKNRLFFFRVKAVRDLDDIFKYEIEYKSFSALELDIIGILKLSKHGRGHTIEDIVKKAYGDVGKTPSGVTRYYSVVFKACKKLIEKGIARKYNAETTGHRPPVRYKLTKRIYAVKKKCPNCGNNKYYISEEDRTYNCVYCGAKWVIPK